MATTQTLLNVNIPSCAPEAVKSIRVCRLGTRAYDDLIVEKEDPRGRAYYWIGGDTCTYQELPDTDFVLSAAGHLTVTPLKVDLTDDAAMADLTSLTESWSG